MGKTMTAVSRSGSTMIIDDDDDDDDDVMMEVRMPNGFIYFSTVFLVGLKNNHTNN
jgi:hypothetical protein